MTEYTPTTEKIRDDFSRFVSDYWRWRSSESKIRRYNYRKRQFNRWLQEERARIWEEAFQIGWDEGIAITKLGHYRGVSSEWNPEWEKEHRTASPYRSEQ